MLRAGGYRRDHQAVVRYQQSAQSDPESDGESDGRDLLRTHRILALFP